MSDSVRVSNLESIFLATIISILVMIIIFTQPTEYHQKIISYMIISTSFAMTITGFYLNRERFKTK